MIVAAAAIGEVASGTAENDIGAEVSIDDILAVQALDLIDAFGAVEGILAVSTDNDIRGFRLWLRVNL